MGLFDIWLPHYHDFDSLPFPGRIRRCFAVGRSGFRSRFPESYGAGRPGFGRDRIGGWRPVGFTYDLQRLRVPQTVFLSYRRERLT